MSNSFKTIVIAMGVLSLVTVGASQTKKAARKPVRRPAVSSTFKPNPSERALVGISLFDTGTRLVKVYGTPDQIQGIGIGTSSAGGGGGAGQPPGPGSGTRGGGGGGGLMGPPGGRGGGGNSGGGGAGGSMDWMLPGDKGLIGDPFDTGATPFRQIGPVLDNPASSGGTRGSGGGGVMGPPGGGRGGGGGPTGGGGAAAGSGERVYFTRWVYNRNAGKYAFIMNKQNQVVQIEAIGYNDPKVKTSKGIRFGATFKDLILKYGAPDAYEIAGDNITVRYLVKNKVAFRLTRIKPNGPQVVTAIVVAAGKN